MLLNYLKLSIRLLTRNPFFTCINVVGLAVGFTSFYVLGQYSTSELKSDQYHEDADRIARIGVRWQWLEQNSWAHVVFGFSKTALLPAVKEDFPEVESTLRILNQNGFSDDLVGHRKRVTISIDDPMGQTRIFKEEKVAYADSNLFDFFSIPLLYGETENVLNEANFVVLSKSIALKYFGNEDPRGKFLRLNDTTTLKVAGVFENLPNNTHLNFNLVISNLSLLNKWNEDKGVWNEGICYVKLSHSNFKDFETKLNQKADVYWAMLRSRPNRKLDMFVQPLTEMPFTGLVGNFSTVKSKPFLITLGFIAFSILIMAWVNYVNLTVTRVSRRFKEIATRKISGARTLDIIGQFVTESIVTNGLALALSLTLIQVVRIPAEDLFDIYFVTPASLSTSSGVIFASIILAGSLATGLYPAIISFAQKPRELFSNNSSLSGKPTIPSLLTVAQLAAAMVFIMLGFTVFLQLNHILNMDTGIKSEQVVVVESPVVKPEAYTTILSTLKNELLALPQVRSVSSSSFEVNQINGAGFNTMRAGAEDSFGMDSNGVDEDFVPLYGLKILAGRNFVSNDLSNRVILSRFASDRLGFKSPEDAVGSTIKVSVQGEPGWKDADIIGIVENFRNSHFFQTESVSQTSNEGRGVVLTYKDQISEKAFTPEFLSVRVMPGDFSETINAIEKLCKREFPSIAFSWSFVDDKINEVYAQEKIARNQIILFTTLAVLIACLGLLGMISHKVVEKTKEISIRKVLGAQLYSIAGVLVHATVKQIAIATLISIPVALYLTKQYLEKYSERITLQWWHFALPVFILALIMFATIASLLWKAATNNPVDALRTE